MLILGTHTYGKVEQVPGVLYRATSFFHINYVPLIPTGGMVVVDRRALGAKEHAYVKAPMSFLSFLMTYVRAALWIALAVVAVMEILAFTDPVIARNGKQAATIFLMTAALAFCGFLLWLSHRITWASRDRAVALADQIGLDREIVEDYFANKPSRARPHALNEPAPPDAGKSDDMFRLE